MQQEEEHAVDTGPWPIELAPVGWPIELECQPQGINWNVKLDVTWLSMTGGLGLRV